MILPSLNTYVTQETLNFNSHYFLSYQYSNYSYHLNYSQYQGGNYNIDRAVAYDLFNYKLEDYPSENPIFLYQDKPKASEIIVYPYIQINNSDKNSFYIDKFKKPFYKSLSKGLKKVHHSLFDSISWAKTSQIAVGADMYSIKDSSSLGSFSAAKPLWRKVLFINKRKVMQNLGGSFQNVFRFDSIAQLIETETSSFTLLKDMPFDQRTMQKLKSKSPQIKYSHIYLYPQSPSLTKGNNVLAKIYYSADAGVQHQWYDDANIQSFAINSSGVKNLNTHFEEQVDQNDRLNLSQDPIKPYLIGVIKVDGYTYYNYNLKHFAVGFGPQASQEDKIPYNFKGIYHRQLHLHLNKIFDNVKIDLYQVIGTALLDPDDGIVRLKIKTEKSDNIALPLLYFSYEDIQEIRKHLIKSLQGFLRLANEH